jgi:UDP-hydrolysing UDP-N-acetyl-D-glucosamine 2-epimerase
MVGVVTTGRADYGALQPVFRALDRRRSVEARWFVTGAHLSRKLGYGVSQIRADGWDRQMEIVRSFVDGDSPSAAGLSIGATTTQFARAFGRRRPDILVVLGDRFEMLGVVAAALPFRIPLAHIHGGEITEGAFDDGVRHAITKLSHLHFVSHRRYAQRVRQLGEERWRVTVSGAPGLDAARARTPVDLRDLEGAIGTPIDREVLLITFHPETLRPEASLDELDAMLAALGRIDRPLILTAPNADPGRDAYAVRLAAFAKGSRRRVMVSNLGSRYFAVLARVGAMVGNSSSGIIEAASFGLPVVNIGGRQRGRLRARNVIDVTGGMRNIETAIRKAMSPAFRASLRRLENPYGDGRASERIASVVSSIPLDDRLLVKRFITVKPR